MLTLGLTLALAARVQALDPGKDLSQFVCHSWSRQNGLPVNGVRAIAQTGDGYLWLGSSVGLVRYDGVDFKLLDLSDVEGLSNNLVTSLEAGRNGGLWIGLEGSAFAFHDGRAVSFKGEEAWGGTSLDVRSLLESQDGSLWFAAQSGAFRLTSAGSFENLLAASGLPDSPNVLCNLEDEEGRVWFGTADQGVFYWQDGRIVALPDPDLRRTTVRSLAKDRQGNLWVGTIVGLFGFDAGLRRMATQPIVEEIRALLVDRQGVLWIGTSGRGLVRLREGSFQFLGKTEGLAGDYVNAIAEDREDSLWVGTRDGVSQVTDVKFPILPAAENPAIQDALSVCPARRGGVWIGSPGGVSHYDETLETHAFETGMPSLYVKRVFEAGNGELYLVCGGQVLSILSPEMEAVATYTNATMVVGMAEDEHGVVVSVGGGLYRAGPDKFEPYEFNNGEVPGMYWILNLATGREGEIWVASAGGIFRVKDGAYRQWFAGEGVTTPVLGICEDDEGVVWAATLSGIIRLKDDRVRYIDQRHGLFDNNIYAIVPDDLGDLWVDSARGVFRVSRADMNAFADGRADHVDCAVYDGLESVKTSDKTVQERVGCKSADGRVWFPTPKGVMVIDPARIPVNSAAPPVHIDQVFADGKEVGFLEHLVLPPGRGELEIRFNALSYIAPRQVRFKYRLEGYDGHWVESGNRRVAFYTNLKPRAYSFEVMAANADGVWSQTGDRLTFELRPHYFQTGWFRLLVGGLAVASLAGTYLWRVRHLRRAQLALQRNRVLLETEVRQRTEELAQANTSLQQEIEGHKLTEAELVQRTRSLEDEIEERNRMQLEVERVHRQLVESSRRADMAEIATNVLHNVGNVLNSVNVSTSVVLGSVRNSRITSLEKVVALLRQHESDLGAFLTEDDKGRQLPSFLARLSAHLQIEQQAALKELDSLQGNIDHIKEIVAMQQNYAKVSGTREIIDARDLVESALNINQASLSRHEVEVIRDYENVPPLNVEKHKVLQILVNLVRNAKQACDESGRSDKRMTVHLANGGGRIKISIEDNGVGIPGENLTRIFNHGFTTRKDGHGFGLHGSALAAREMGGSLTARSDGPGEGATFTLELPCDAQEETHG